MQHTATYSPEDNKLRLYPAHRLDAEEYARVKAAGFIWAPKQELFVAPMWTPSREDLLLEMCGEIDDEDKSLVERAEERAERFEDYSDNRKEDYNRIYKTVDQIAERFAGGQPILVGHHSEKKARKDAERIDNGMRKAIKMWDQSKYWASRAKGAIAAAKYKERPGVRARRIKGLEADRRKQAKNKDKAEMFIRMWKKIDEPAKKHDGTEATKLEKAMYIANSDYISRKFTLAEYPREEPISQYEGDMGLWSALEHGIITPDQAAALAIPIHERSIVWHDRWLQHLDNRLLYEKAMLEEAGGTAADKFDIQVGGRVLVRGEWVTVLRVNKGIDGRISTLTTARKYVAQVGIEEVQDYRPPTEEQAATVKAVMKPAPLCNYPSEAFCTMTKVEYANVYGGAKGGTAIKGTEAVGAHRVRSVQDYIARKYGKPDLKQWSGFCGVYITDEKRKDPPGPDTAATPKIEAPERVVPQAVYHAPAVNEEVEAMKGALKEGIKIVVAPTLFPTPPEIAARMVELAEIEDGHRVLEPSAGTGNLLAAIGDGPFKVAIEINYNLSELLSDATPANTLVKCADFLTCTPEAMGLFDRVIMNPPFDNGIDVKHIRHALTFVKCGGILVALCANGPRQREAFKGVAEYWEDLPEGSFKEAGTGVNVALMKIRKEDV